MEFLYIKIINVEPSVLIVSDFSELLDQLAITYYPFAVKASEFLDAGVVIHIKKYGDNFNIIWNSHDVMVESLQQVSYIIRKWIDVNLSCCNDYIGLHSAVLFKNDIALLLLGKTKSGKTTLATYMGLNGYDYGTDDKVIVPCNKNSLHELIPFNSNVHIREESLKMLNDKYHQSINADKINIYGGIRYILPLLQPKNFCFSKVITIFLNCCNGKDTILTPVHKYEAVEMFIRQSIFPGKTHRLLSKISELLRWVDVYQMTYYDLCSALGKIDDLVIESSISKTL